MDSLQYMHRGLLSLYSSGLVMFFAIAIILVIIIINVGFMTTDSEKQVVIKAMEEADDHLMIAGKISGVADTISNKLTVVSIPVRPVSATPISVDLQNIDISFKLTKIKNQTVIYDNIYVGNLNTKTFDSISDAVADAKLQGLIELDPFIDQQKNLSTAAFVYWIINHNFDQKIDSKELAAIAIIYSENDKPTTGEFLQVQANEEEGYVLKIERYIPNITGTFFNFG
jgi:archaellin